MKIYINNKVYVSRKDLVYALMTQNDMPDEIKYLIFNQNSNNNKIEVNKENKDDFFIFDTNEAKEYFCHLDYILNYGSYKKYDINYLKQMLAVVTKHRIDLLDTFCKYDEPTKIANMGLRKQIDDLNIFLIGLNDLIEMKENKSRIILPKRERKNYYQEKEEKAKTFLYKMMQPINY